MEFINASALAALEANRSSSVMSETDSWEVVGMSSRESKMVPGARIARCCQRSIFASESQPEGSECWLSVRLAVGMETYKTETIKQAGTFGSHTTSVVVKDGRLP